MSCYRSTNLFIIKNVSLLSIRQWKHLACEPPIFPSISFYCIGIAGVSKETARGFGGKLLRQHHNSQCTPDVDVAPSQLFLFSSMHLMVGEMCCV